jgi:hypothetical protein
MVYDYGYDIVFVPRDPCEQLDGGCSVWRSPVAELTIQLAAYLEPVA